MQTEQKGPGKDCTEWDENFPSADFLRSHLAIDSARGDVHDGEQELGWALWDVVSEARAMTEWVKMNECSQENPKWKMLPQLHIYFPNLPWTDFTHL